VRKPSDERGPKANRTLARIQRATRLIFQRRGYAGTTIDRITDAAGVSRATFYTYFPSKRDVLLSLGADSIRDSVATIKEFEALPPTASRDDLRRWVAHYFHLLDRHGSFAFAWTQAAHEDRELHQVSVSGHLRLCRRLGDAMGLLKGEAFEDPVSEGILLSSLLERAWSYTHLYEGVLDRGRVERDAADFLADHLGVDNGPKARVTRRPRI
jgi:AcrR family transcriptional regulator